MFVTYKIIYLRFLLLHPLSFFPYESLSDHKLDLPGNFEGKINIA